MITKLVITTPQDTPGQTASRKVGQSHVNLAVDNGGHYLQQDDPALVIKAIRDLLRACLACNTYAA